MDKNKNKLLVPGLEDSLQQAKYEIAQEFGMSTEEDEAKGEEITERLINQVYTQVGPKRRK